MSGVALYIAKSSEHVSTRNDSATPDNVLPRIITGDETWIHYWDPDTKQDSMQWKHVNSPPPRKFCTQPLAGKVMATVFWDYKVVLLVDYLPQKTAITGPHYGEVLTNLCQAVKEKQRGMLTRGPLLLHGNAPAHMSRLLLKLDVLDYGLCNSRVSSCTGHSQGHRV